MKHGIKLASVITLAIFFVACAVGTKFEKPQNESLILGQTTNDEILERFGKPYSQGEEIKDGKALKWISYSYANQAEHAAFKSVIPCRTIVFYFVDGSLVGHSFYSTFKEESTYLDPAQVKMIKEGTTTRSQVIDLFGDDYGLCLYPQFSLFLNRVEEKFKKENGKGFIYKYFQTKPAGYTSINYAQELIISFNEEDIVSNIYFSASGQM